MLLFLFQLHVHIHVGIHAASCTSCAASHRTERTL